MSTMDPTTHSSKRARYSSPDRKGTSGRSPPPNTGEGEDPTEHVKEGAAKAVSGGSSSFRNVSACNRCRLRKNRCDQKLPSCASCEKAGVKCVGYDPITKREIPRSYVFYLETRVGYLENLLLSHSISFDPAEVLDHASRPGADPNLVQTPSDDGRQQILPGNNNNQIQSEPSTAVVQQQQQQNKQTSQEAAWNKKQDESEKLNKLVSNIGSVSVQGASDSRYLGSTSGISFARVVFAAVKSSVSGASSDKSGVKPSRPPPSGGAGNKGAGAGGATSMRDSFFGLHTKPTIKQAPFPSKDVGRRLVNFYFEHANPQVPILHRGEFMKLFEGAYLPEGGGRVRGPRELYMLNIVFAIGSGIFLGDTGEKKGNGEGNGKDGEETRWGGADKQCQPEEYHASAIVHLEACLSSPTSLDKPDGFGGGLEELQAVLLLAGFALLRPVAPGLWYIIGVAVRLAIDLGLHYEDGKDLDVGVEQSVEGLENEDTDVVRMQKERAARERGRREWVRDFRRRLWWCTYSLDRLVSTCVGRPFGISDQVITTEFPSPLDDKYITPTGFLKQPSDEPTYKAASYHYFRLRLLQSEILQVLQHQQAQQARAGGANQRNEFMHTKLPSPFLSKFDSFRSWRIDIDKRLWEWKVSAPTKRDTGVAFSLEFLDLNYWQCVIMLYRQSLSVPQMFEGEYNTSNEVNSPEGHHVELREDEERVFLKVAEAGQRVLRLYRQLHRVHLVNYTFLATHHLFMAGISFLYAIWHSSIVRSRLTMDEVDFTILAATSVLGDLIEKCPPAEACRDAFDRMSKATVQMCMSTTGFGSGLSNLNSRQRSHSHHHGHAQSVGATDHYSKQQQQYRRNSREAQSVSGNIGRSKTQFDMGLNDLLNSSQTTPNSMQSPTSLPPFHTPNSQNSGMMNQSSPTTTIKMEPFSASATPRNDLMRSSTAPTQGGASTMPSPSEYAISPPLSSLDNSQIDPSLLPSPNQNFNSSAGGFPGGMEWSNFQSAPGMDFLQQGGWGNGGGGGGGGEGGMGGGVEGGWNGDLGMGLNLGSMGWDDGSAGGNGVGNGFSEGGSGGVDLFDGFFFGGGGATGNGF